MVHDQPSLFRLMFRYLEIVFLAIFGIVCFISNHISLDPPLSSFFFLFPVVESANNFRDDGKVDYPLHLGFFLKVSFLYFNIPCVLYSLTMIFLPILDLF